jgi:hypothetical protein
MEASKMTINQGKSEMFFFNTHIAIQNHISRILGFQRSYLPTKYLGAPLTTSTLRNVTWEDLSVKMERKLNNWTYNSKYPQSSSTIKISFVGNASLPFLNASCPQINHQSSQKYANILPLGGSEKKMGPSQL